jgi:superfamily I DNA and/or RNA helicase
MIDQMPNLLGKLCPVMLMSPQSVAQYINVAQEPFDLVIFDEASQMPTCDAVGAIARAGSAIIVGDTKQMPPTNFFAISQVEDADIDDLESILDDCIALSLPMRTLRWHYRSNHEELISFSNRRYYDDSLITFPSADSCCTHIVHQHIDGYYDMGNSRTNRAEAEAIVAEIIHRLETAPEKSIGVVAFSIQQSNLIEDLMSEAFAANPALDRLNATNVEPLFIKNLENVQGDERDVILLSIGYGPDKDGKVSMNFGPLNKAGGGRRLNVAITRARHEMKIFSTLRSEDIDPRRTQAEGVLDLKAFLQFAESGKLYNKEIYAEKSSVIAEQLRRWLQSLGYEAVCNVGKSTCNVDVAVFAPDSKERYQLGIVINGVNHYKLDTTRDREIVCPRVLQYLGWNLYRVNVVDWFRNPDFVKSEILHLLQ